MDMIRKLQIKFIMTAVISMTAIMTLILGSINVLNYQDVVQMADNVLDILIEYQGTFPKAAHTHKDYLARKLSLETPYESRYFSVRLGEDGSLLNLDTSKIAAVTQEQAEEYAREIANSPDDRGFLYDFRFRKQTTASSHGEETFVVFLNCEHTLNAFRHFVTTSITIAGLGFALVFVGVLAASKRITRPYVENYEKQKRFITDAGHELKTPLTILDADAAVLEMDGGDNEWLRDIHTQVRRMKELTNDLIYLAKMEEGRSNVQMTEFSLSEVAMDTAASFQALAKVEHKVLQCQIQPMVGYCGDPKSITRLFSILLDNAVKYTTLSGEISFVLQKKGRNIHITVTNTTELVDPSQIRNLFDRFYRSEQSRNSEMGGHGIGLSIAKGVVHAHQGKIGASYDGHSLKISIVL